MVNVTVRDDIILQNKLIDLLERDDIYEAAFWAKKLQLDEVSSPVSRILENIERGLDTFPVEEEDFTDDINSANLQNVTLNGPNEVDTQETSDWNNSAWPSGSFFKTQNEYYEFPLPDTEIIFIDDRSGLNEFVEYLRKSPQVRIE